jgi:hypothetical protein
MVSDFAAVSKVVVKFTSPSISLRGLIILLFHWSVYHHTVDLRD